MYRFIKDSTVLSTLNNPKWITVYDNGCFGLCEQSDANGVLIDGTVYHIDGKNNILGTESVTMVEITEHQHLQEQKELQAQMEMAIAELSILIANLQKKEE